MFFPRKRAVLLALALGVVAGCSRKPEPVAEGPPPQVAVLEVVRRDVPIERVWIGTVEGAVNAEIRAQVSGYLISQAYREGARVKRGQLLFTVDARPLEAEYGQALASLARARAAQVKAEQDECRNLLLFDRSVISAQERDRFVEAAAATRAETLAQQAVVDHARISLGFTRIYSPVDGIAGLANGQIGDLVGPSAATPLTVVSMVNPVKAYVTVNEQAYIEETQRLLSDARLMAQIPLELILADGSGYPHPGAFYAADREVDPRTGALRFALLFANPEGHLRPGLFCRVRARIGIRKGALLVPQRAVRELQGINQIAVIGKGNKVALRNVRLGERHGSLWLVEEGVSPGERVVVEGELKARSGLVVNPVAWKPPPGYLELRERAYPTGPKPVLPPGVLQPTVKE